ncbi:MAG: hypothetical protein GF388_11470, partial [Candidatus Aegiribacteria sp.]|nr:hypothetical protein [Candidatus Aegiribacteria sp.]MBD3295609.1 hypothetical protein [Candidatus Fermentibacteria bacterium]
GHLSLVQEVFVTLGASQCGFCTPGMIAAITGYLLCTTHPTGAGAVESLAGNICRCTGYTSVKEAAEEIAGAVGVSPASNSACIGHLKHLVEKRVIPRYFLSVAPLLADIQIDPSEAEGLPQPSDDTVMVAGGTDLYAAEPEKVIGTDPVFLSERPELTVIGVSRERVTVGACSTVEDIKESSIFSGTGNFQDSLLRISSPQIRSRATAGGNIVNASPIGDLTIMFLALEAVLVLESNTGTRRVPLKEFYKGYKELDLRSGELVTSVEFRKPAAHSFCNFEKVAMRQRMDIASVNSAACLEISGGVIGSAAVSAGGVAPIPLYLESLGTFLKNRKITADTVEKAAEVAMESICPIDDVRGSADYKRKLLGRLVKAHFLALFPEILDPEDLL